MRIFKSITLMLFFLFFASSIAIAQPINSLFRNGNDPVAGNPHGDITIVEFFDYQCSYCKRMAPVLDQIIKKNPNVRIVFKELPIKGPVSDFASAAALAAKKQDKYYRFNHALLGTRQPLSENLIQTIAQHSGINVKKLEQDMKDSSITRQLQENLRLANILQVNGTPAFFIGKTNAKSIDEVKFFYGAMSQAELQDEINKATR